MENPQADLVQVIWNASLDTETRTARAQQWMSMASKEELAKVEKVLNDLNAQVPEIVVVDSAPISPPIVNIPSKITTVESFAETEKAPESEKALESIEST